MLWHNNPSPSILMVNVTGSPEQPTDTPGAGKQRLFTRDSDGHLCRIESDDSVTDLEAPPTASALVRLSQIVTTGSQATVDFTSISSDYQSLQVIFSSQDTAAGTSASSVFLKINNDGTSGNYTSTQRLGTTDGAIGGLTLVAASASGSFVYDQPNAGNTGIATGGQILIPNYAATTFHKTFVANWREEHTVANNYQTAGRWKSTAAITRLTFSTAGTAFTDGSTFTLYGIT